MEKETNKLKKATSTSKKPTSKKSTAKGTKKVIKAVEKKATTKKGVKKEQKSVAIKTSDMETKTKKVLTPVVDENKKNTFTIEKEDKTNNEKLVKEKNSINSNEKSIKQSAKEFFNSEIGTLIKIVFVIACVILVFLLITNVINDIKKDKKDPVTNGTIQYDEILVSNILKQQNTTYYVLVYDSKDLYYNAYNTYITTYKGSENAQRFYTAVLSNGFNKKYYSEKDSNVVGANIDNLKFKGTTLVKVENGAIVASYEDSTSILNFLKSL